MKVRAGMVKTKYDKIYLDIKNKIEKEIYCYKQLLPSEHTLVKQYVQSLHGKGVRVIFGSFRQSEYTLGSVESFKESSIRNIKQK